jgi:iron complex outermembrane receptor protein
MRFKTLLAGGCAVAALVTTPVSAQDAADQAKATPPARSDDIIVTARQRQESLKDVPIAVTAIY